jgi:IclR family acetate operon transcriptional repressor
LVKSATRTLDILELVVSRGRPLVAQEIADALAIPVSSLSYLLTTLVDRDYLSREGRHYRSGDGLSRLQARSPDLALSLTVAPLVRTLRAELNETSSFFVRRGWEVEALVTEPSEHALRYAVQKGAKAPLHAFSAGKALLAVLEEDELSRYFAVAERERFTPMTVIDEPALRREIAEIRAHGFARTNQEHTLGIQGFGRTAEIDGVVVGAFSVAVPVARLDAQVERDIIAALVRMTDQMNRR